MNIVLIGKPGSGKGSLTQQLIAFDNSWYQLAPGEVMRDKMKNDTDEVSQILRDLLGSGNYAPDHITISIVKDKISSLPNGTNIIFDGFPRTPAQSQMLIDNFDIDLVVYINATDECVKERLPYRLNHPASGRVYNEITHPPLVQLRDDATGDVLVKRDDDKLELIDQRIKNFYSKTYPAYEYLVEKKVPHIEINGQLSEKEIFQIVKKQLYVEPKRKCNI